MESGSLLFLGALLIATLLFRLRAHGQGLSPTPTQTKLIIHDSRQVAAGSRLILLEACGRMELIALNRDAITVIAHLGDSEISTRTVPELEPMIALGQQGSPIAAGSQC